MQNKINTFNNTNSKYITPCPVHTRLIDIISEMGELSKEYIKSTNYGNSQFVLTDSFKEEYGDVLYSMLSLATELGIDSEDCIDKVLEKMEKRIIKNKTIGSGR